MNDLASYRSAIGLFHIKLQRLSKSYIFITRPVQLFINSILGYILRTRSFLNKCLPKLNYVICNYYFSFIVVLLTCHSYHHHFDLHKQGCSDYTNYHFCGYDGESVFVLIYYSVIVQFLLIISGDVELNPGPIATPQISTISIFHQNIRSLRNKLEYIKTHFTDYDILCFTESKLSIDIPDNTILLDGFDKFYRKDNSSHSGGLITYISPHLISRSVPELDHLLPEALWVEFKNKNETYLLCNIYRPPNTPVEFWNRFNICIEKASELCSKI